MDHILPARLSSTRPYGQFGYTSELRSKSAYANVSGIDSSSDFHIPQRTIYGRCPAPPLLSPPSPDVLTVVGVGPSQRHLLERHFRRLGLSPEIQMSDRGNWAYLRFSSPVEEIPSIERLIQLDSHVIVGCYIGRFEREELLPVPPRETATCDNGSARILKLPKEPNLAAKPLEEKSHFALFSEFVLGRRNVPRERGSLLTAAHSLLSRLWPW